MINYEVPDSDWLNNLIVNPIKLTPYRVIWEVLKGSIYKF